MIGYRTLRSLTLLAARLAFGIAGVVGGGGAQQLPPMRTVGAVLATSADSFGSVTSVRALPGGRVLVNDVGRRRVVLLDSTLRQATIVADSTANTANAYGGRFGALIAYRGDSSLFIDPASMSMLVIDPAGKIAHVMSVPRSQDAIAMAAPNTQTTFDAAGRLVYRGQPRMSRPPAEASGFAPPQFPDSAPIVRVDLATRKLDTLTFVKTPKVNLIVNRNDNGGMMVTSEINPMPVTDDWTVLADGSVAVVRGRDYRVEIIQPDGARKAALKVPYEWQRLTDEDKVAVLDSARAAMEAARKSAAAGGSAPGGDRGNQVFIMGGPPAGRGGDAAQMPPLTMVPASELPDYRPAFTTGATRADPEGNVWVRTTLSRPGAGPVYDVIDAKGALIDRVQLPVGRTLIGFGPPASGIAYLVSREDKVTKLQRVLVR